MIIADRLGIAKGPSAQRLRDLQDYLAITHPLHRCPCRKPFTRDFKLHFQECPFAGYYYKEEDEAKMEELELQAGWELDVCSFFRSLFPLDFCQCYTGRFHRCAHSSNNLVYCFLANSIPLSHPSHWRSGCGCASWRASVTKDNSDDGYGTLAWN